MTQIGHQTRTAARSDPLCRSRKCFLTSWVLSATRNRMLYRIPGQAVGAFVTLRRLTEPSVTLTRGTLITDVTPAKVSASPRVQDPDVLVTGLGYVGLPLAAEATRPGLTVVSYDSSPAVGNGLNAGRSHIAVTAANLVTLLQAHDAYDTDDIARHAQQLLDTRWANYCRGNACNGTLLRSPCVTRTRPTGPTSCSRSLCRG
jgi:hypothetical protein